MIGTRTSHYEILEKVGEGGMGVVYKAKDLRLDRTVALKFLPAQTASSKTESRRFQQEAKALSSLNHPNIATIYDIDEADGRRFIALEYLPGGTLRAKIRKLRSAKKELSPAEIIGYALQVASALSHAHHRSLIHRDIKTENLMLAADGTVKITDFGLARFGAERTLTKTGHVVGTAAYMSPEQVRGEKIDRRSDIFSFGVVLYELVTGKLPFEADHEPAVMYSVLNKDVTDLEEYKHVSPALRGLILKCLAKKKEDRFQDCDEIVQELERMGSGVPGAASMERPDPSRSALVLRFALILPVLGGLGFLIYFIIARMAAEPASVPSSIAVLYMENVSGDEQYTTFAAGMTEEIINELANVPGVQVVSRSDVQPYRGKEVDIREVGEKLGVAYILESSLRTEGKNIRVTCQAIQTADRFHFWSQAYTREMKGAFEVQSDIARQVALGLKTRFAQRELEQKLGLPPNSLQKEGKP